MPDEPSGSSRIVKLQTLMHQRCIWSFLVLAYLTTRLDLPRRDSSNRYSKGFELFSKLDRTPFAGKRFAGLRPCKYSDTYWCHSTPQIQMYVPYIRSGQVRRAIRVVEICTIDNIKEGFPNSRRREHQRNGGYNN